MKRIWMVVFAALAMLALSNVSAAEPVEGKDYVRLKNALPVETGKKIEVIEFFSYGCPHCNDLEPFLHAWAEKLPADVQFRRIPVIFQERWKGLARVYYTLEALGEDMRLSPEVFKAYHQQGLPLYQDKAFFDWAASKGLDKTKVSEIYNSFAVNSKMSRATSMAQAYNIQAVPTVIVDGKYLTSSDRVGTHAQLPAELDALVAKARSERPKT
jgi:thiol:disulfide interchange protein DsbA